MTSGDNSSGAGDGNEPRQPSFNWGLTPSDPEAPPAATPAKPEEPHEAEEPEVSQAPPAPLVEPPATEAMNVADLPTSAMNVADLPTGAMDVADLPTTSMNAPTRRQTYLPAAIDPALEGATEVLSAQSLGGISPVAESVDHDAVGDLFGDDKFVEYEDQLLAAQGSAVVVRQRAPLPPRPPIPRGPMIALAVGGGLVAALALVALFLLGTRIGPTVAPATVASATPTAAPTAVEPIVGPVAPGVYQWNELAGGECLDPFASAWEQEYTVIECAQPHAAQLLAIGQFDDAATDPYPDAEQLAARAAKACSTDAVIDFAAAQPFSDLEVLASFAATADEWDAGNRDYYCFATRAGDDALTASVAQPQTPAS